MFRPMRRFKQQISEEECVRILQEEKRGVLSMFGEDGYPYGIPLNHWYNPEDGKIYFHGAKPGTRLTPSPSAIKPAIVSGMPDTARKVNGR